MAGTYKKVSHAKSRSPKDIIVNLDDLDFHEEQDENSYVVIVNTSPQDIAPVIEALKRYKENEEKKEQVRIGIYVDDISEVVESRRKV